MTQDKGIKMTLKVEAYDLGWNVRTNTGLVKIKLSNQEIAKIKVNSLGDLAGWAAILSQSSLFIKDGWIHTGSETIGKAFSEGGEVPFPY
ncbi:hypothetical protein [Candidatus Methylomicrobium oryzae]|uniref:hypothetical protein n=1 Tax=Candidatus Methylomicrobium oryzae TaxID=2802053 RepID=UPI0019237AA2|nr:hypothetical protein [Methylomicrobium sp. RS1]MBL1262680.1 hypothetical protein [Methylomicrobium sp. RS1]